MAFAPDPSAWARFAALLVEFAVARGVDRSQLLAAGGLSEGDLERQDSRLPARSLYDMIEAAARSIGDEHLGLHLAQSVPNGIEVLGFLLRTSPTLGAALEALVRYQRLLNDGEEYRLERDGDGVRLSLHYPGPPHPAQRHLTELVLYELTTGSERIFGRALPVTSIEFRAERPTRPEVYAQAYGDRLVFGAALDGIIIPTEALALPLPGAHPEMQEYFVRQLDAALDQLPPPTLTFAGRVQAWVSEHLARAPGLSDVARALGMSPRTLQRRLRREGLTVREIVDAARREHAERILLATGSIADAARRLGYSEPSAFHRAFRRWTGRTPGEVLSGSRVLQDDCEPS